MGRDWQEELRAIGDASLAELTRVHKAREEALNLCRSVIRHSANAIRAMHRRQMADGAALLEQARADYQRAAEALKDYPEVYYAGFLGDAGKEYAEACILLAVLSGTRLPTFQELGVGLAPYLNGLAEAASELRRYILDSMRQGDDARNEELMAVMDDIYSLLVTLDFPDAITGGLRRTTDALRAVLERTRGDLTLAQRQRELIERLSLSEGR